MGYKMGVLLDNMRDYKSAIKQYKKFLSICVRTNDVVGEALAFNSIAVDYQLIGGEKALRKAIEYHTKHRDMADIPGKFTAYTNLGMHMPLLVPWIRQFTITRMLYDMRS